MKFSWTPIVVALALSGACAIAPATSIAGVYQRTTTVIFPQSKRYVSLSGRGSVRLHPSGDVILSGRRNPTVQTTHGTFTAGTETISTDASVFPTARTHGGLPTTFNGTPTTTAIAPIVIGFRIRHKHRHHLANSTYSTTTTTVTIGIKIGEKATGTPVQVQTPSGSVLETGTLSILTAQISPLQSTTSLGNIVTLYGGDNRTPGGSGNITYVTPVRISTSAFPDKALFIKDEFRIIAKDPVPMLPSTGLGTLAVLLFTLGAWRLVQKR